MSTTTTTAATTTTTTTAATTTTTTLSEWTGNLFSSTSREDLQPATSSYLPPVF